MSMPGPSTSSMARPPDSSGGKRGVLPRFTDVGCGRSGCPIRPDTSRSCSGPGPGGEPAGQDFADLIAIGVPLEDITRTNGTGGTTQNPDAGLVHIIYGTGGGLDSTSDSADGTQSSSGPTDPAGDRFGSPLAAADFESTLTPITPWGSPVRICRIERPGGHVRRGWCPVTKGSSQGIVDLSSAFFCQDSLSVPGKSESGDRFGASLGAGDLGGTEFSDLAVGAARRGYRRCPTSRRRHPARLLREHNWVDDAGLQHRLHPEGGGATGIPGIRPRAKTSSGQCSLPSNRVEMFAADLRELRGAAHRGRRGGQLARLMNRRRTDRTCVETTPVDPTPGHSCARCSG